MARMLVGYARCSTDQQDLTAQRDALTALGVKPNRIYVDHGLTGTNRARPGLREALAACRSGDTLVVTKLDRLARSLTVHVHGRMVRDRLLCQPLPAAASRTDTSACRAHLPPRRPLQHGGNVMSGAITNRFGPRVPAVAGQLSMVIGLVAMVITAPLGSPLLTAILLILIGPGGSVAMPVIAGLVFGSVPPERAGTASAVFNTFRQVGGAVASAVFGAFLTNSASFVTGMQPVSSSPHPCSSSPPW